MDTGMKYTPACDQVAARFKVDSRTVRNHAPNPNSRKRK